jgi:adenosylcobinamide-GDP ribazoletransferase
VLLSGALHLDGLGDCVDAWVGGYGERERTLAIMKDPRCGPMAVVALCLLLLLKCAALSVLLPAGQGVAVLLAVWLARSLLPLLFYCTPYVRAEGLGAALSRHLPRQTVPYLLAVQAGLCLLFGWAGVYALLAALGCFYLARRAMLQRLGGCTGDCAGALVELAELAILLVLALALG